MRSPLVALALTSLALAGCQRRGQVSPETVSRSLKGVLLFPHSTLVTMSSGDSAGQLTVTAPATPDSVAAWYRSYFAMNDWKLQSDAVQQDGTILMYAVHGSRPLWISLQRSAGGASTTYTVTGAFAGSADSTAADSTQRSGSSMSSKRIQRR